ncbi:MAG: hypothetical protein K0Q76_704 [Panacagrimonas sp.]|nr:hypothetical protein [Panacagrimonas sp.]MCC2655596.1 hypothetical protein [Panacagrimonas sp.]
MATSNAKPWRFYRAGGLDQVRIENGADIAALGRLDRKLWVALACPVKGLEFDERTLALIDSDGDGRVRAAEIVGAVEFLDARLRSLDTLLPGSDTLALSDLNDATPEGQASLASARRILANLGREGDAIAFADIAAPEKFFEGTLFNGDGVITPESAEADEALAQVLRDIMAAHGSINDRSGNPGVDRARIEGFFAEAKALDEWLGTAKKDPALLPFGEGTAAAYAAVTAIKAKVDDYFARTRVAAFDARALEAVNRAEEDYLKAAASDLSVSAQEMAGFPLARIEANRALPLTAGLNPAWTGAIADLRRAALAPMFGELTELTDTQWAELNTRLAAHAAWATGRPATQLGGLTDARVQGLLAEGAQDKVLALLQRDEALKDETSGMDAVEKLVRLNRDFVRLLHNFVSFGDFYSRKRPATFQAGHLFLDSRECTLCVRVDDAGKHAVLASLSKCYLAYCDLSRRNAAGATEKMAVLAVFTQGDSDYLTVGRNGLFIDRKGHDWDATITKIVDAPISIRQAFFAPYKKFVRMIEEQVAKRAAAADAASDARLASHAEGLAHVDKSGATPPAAAPPPAPAPKKLDLGTIALIGTAISGIAAMAGLVLEKFFGLGMYMPLGLLAIVLLISGPAMLIAALKLRQRSLGPILDASGWAINGRVRVNMPLGVALTSIAKLPPGSSLSLQDPFEEKKSAWPTILAVLAVVLMVAYGAYRQGWLDRWLPEKWDVAKPVPAETTAPPAATS